MGPTWGPPGAARTQVGPMLATRPLLSGSLPPTSFVTAPMPVKQPWLKGVDTSPGLNDKAQETKDQHVHILHCSPKQVYSQPIMVAKMAVMCGRQIGWSRGDLKDLAMQIPCFGEKSIVRWPSSVWYNYQLWCFSVNRGAFELCTERVNSGHLQTILLRTINLDWSNDK